MQLQMLLAVWVLQICGLVYALIDCARSDTPQFLLNEHGALKQTVRDSGAKIHVTIEYANFLAVWPIWPFTTPTDISCKYQHTNPLVHQIHNLFQLEASAAAGHTTLCLLRPQMPPGFFSLVFCFAALSNIAQIRTRCTWLRWTRRRHRLPRRSAPPIGCRDSTIARLPALNSAATIPTCATKPTPSTVVSSS